MDASDLGMIEIPKTNEDVTHRDIPDPEKLPEIGGNNVLIRPVATKTDKIGNILLPEDFQDDVKYLHNVGKVLAIGPLVYTKSDGTKVQWFATDLEVGDYVQFQRFVGDRFKYQGVNLVLVIDKALKMKIDNPEDVDPMQSVEPQ